MAGPFRRPLGTRRYKRMFVIVAEGTVTEQEYFALLEEPTIVRVKCLSNKQNLPPDKALDRVQEYVRKEGLRNGDQAWVVVDKDSWPEAHLQELHKWAQKRPEQYGFALSNPKFEYWLLLHFEDAKGITSSADCDKRLAKYLAKNKKHVNGALFQPERIQFAIKMAEKRDVPRCVDWPRRTGTTVYRLVKAILGEVS